MKIKQLSVFLENKTGRLSDAVNVLAKNGIDISALSLADTAEFGMLRMIVDQPDRARELLKESGVVVRVTEVIAIVMDDVPGGIVSILNLLAEGQINVEYMYACVGRVSGKALAVLRVDDADRTEKLLQEHGYDMVKPADVYRI